MVYSEITKRINNLLFTHETFYFLASHELLTVITEIFPTIFIISFPRAIRTFMIVLHGYPSSVVGQIGVEPITPWASTKCSTS